jgi:hypothetical protein
MFLSLNATTIELLEIYASLKTSGLKNMTPKQMAILAYLPITPPPPGITPNFTNPPTLKLLYYVVTSVLLPIMMTFIINRVYVKRCF